MFAAIPLLLFLLLVPDVSQGAVVINEIHADAEPNTEKSEFIELFNDGVATVDLGGWHFTDGIGYAFPAGTRLDPGGYLVVAADPDAFRRTFGPRPGARVIAHWGFDEPAGPAAADSSGTLNGAGEAKTAVASGGVQFGAEGRFGRGVSLDGTSGSQLVIPHLDELWEGSYTLAAWVRPADRTVNAILADNAAPQSFMFSVDTTARMSHRYASGFASTAATWSGSGGVIASNTWHHVAAVWDQEAQVCRIYLNGALVFRGVAGKMPVELAMVRNARPWNIGRNQANSESFNGGIDELWVIRGALPGASILTLMNENRVAPTEVVDLADIVGGGDGSIPGQSVERGLNAADGQPMSGFNDASYSPALPGGFYPVAHPMIDGVFVPNGMLVASGGQQITSTGIMAPLPSSDGDPSPGYWADGGGQAGDPSKVNSDAAYYLPKYLEQPRVHSLLTAMTQKGITFDLDAIEASREGRQITAFTAVAGDSRVQPGGRVSVAVLVDGVERFRTNSLSGAEAVIDVGIPAEARFLTLVVGNSDNINTSDHGFFADPFLHLQAPVVPPAPPAVLGPYEGGLSSEGELVVLRNAVGKVVDQVEYAMEFPWPVAASGEGNSMELQHPSLDNQLGGSWRSSIGLPTPGRRNSVFTENAAPQVRQVAHNPVSPHSSEPITVTAKVTDPQGVASVLLHYQVVLPGRYIPAYLARTPAQVTDNPTIARTPNPAFEAVTNWVTLPMVDTGAAGDVSAGDSIYTVVIPGQANRTLLRYRITVTDLPGASVRVPYADDPSLNFAAYVYDGVPDFVAATRSVTGKPGYVHPKEVLTSIPVYSLITLSTDLARCVAYDAADQLPANNFESREAFNWNGTFVYNGLVHDHIQYRLRQRNDRYGGSGKRSFRFRFNRGHYIQFHDMDGTPYPEKWRTLDSHKMSARGGPNMGLNEVANSHLWKLFGVPSPSAHWFHFRVVDGIDEAPAGKDGQHLGDFWGLMLALEDYDSHFLSSRNLPDGNIYKLNSYILNGKEVQRYQAANSVADASDFYNILNNLRPERTDAWLNTHVDYPAWYRYHTVVDAVRHYDVAPNTGEHLKNRAWYFRPDPATPLGKLMTLPWDSDTSWGPNWNGGEDFSKAAVITPNKADFVREYRNVVREFRDLIWQRDQIEPMLDQFESRLAAFQLADRDRWTGSPAVAGNQADPPLSDKVADMKRFAFLGGTWEGGDDPSEPQAKDSGISGQQGRDAYLDWLQADPAIPNTPEVTYAGAPGYPANGLAFTSSPFSDPQGAGTFAAMEWRLAEYRPDAVQPDDEPIVAPKSVWKYDDSGVDPGVAWREPAYDDSAWRSGKGDFGFGKAGIETTNSWGSVTNNKYPAYYFRKRFTVSEPERFTALRLGVRRDDGAVVYLNGTEVFRTGMPLPPVVISHKTRANSEQSGANETNYFAAVLPLSSLVAGENSLAVEVHLSSTNNPDMRFDLTLGGIRPVPPAPARLVWEYEHRWKSPLITNFTAGVSIPAVATREGRVYRVRVRHQDNTGRWSHWSAPAQFTTTPPGIEPLLQNLVVSEILYDPAPETPAQALAGWGSQDFEWIELENRSPVLPLDLTDVRFTQGVTATVAPGTILAPGARCLLVRSRAAFELRYGAGLPVVGEFPTSRLDNGGEVLKLSYGGGVPIREFRYDDDAPWPVNARSNGRTISFVSGAPVERQGDGLFWRSGPATPGAPNVFVTGWNAWLDNFFSATDPNRAVRIPGDADPDGDGVSNLMEYLLGSSPVVATSTGGLIPGVVRVGNELHFVLSMVGRADVSLIIEGAPDLESWSEVAFTEHSRVAMGDGSDLVTYRLASPLSGAPRHQFFRVHAFLR